VSPVDDQGDEHPPGGRPPAEIERELVRAFLAGYGQAVEDGLRALRPARAPRRCFRLWGYRRRQGVGSLGTTTPKDRS